MKSPRLILIFALAVIVLFGCNKSGATNTQPAQSTADQTTAPAPLEEPQAPAQPAPETGAPAQQPAAETPAPEQGEATPEQPVELAMAAPQTPAPQQGRDGYVVSKTRIEKTGTYAVYQVTYMSTGLKVKGLMYENLSSGGKPLPGIVFNHGGVSGIPGKFKTRSKEIMKQGYHVFAPSYRGEDGSQGSIEVAAGEVYDALNAVLVLQHWPGVDPSRMAMAGTSHGGIITLLAAQRMPLAAAVCAYGVTNTFSWYKFLVDYGHDVTDKLSRQVYGYGPEDKPENFRARAPALDAYKTKAPVLLIYGREDNIVPMTQGQEMAIALQGANKYYEFEVVDGAGHGFLFKDDANARKGWLTIYAFLDKFLK